MAVEIEWIDSVSSAATGNKIYRDDVEIADIANGVQIYLDNTTAAATEYKYEVQAHDGAGNETTQEVDGVNVDYITTEGAPELVVNGDFEDGSTGWSLEGGASTSWDLSGGDATRTSSADWGMTQSILATAAVNYRISLDITVLTSGILRVSCGDLTIQEQFDSQGLGQTFDIPWGADDGIIKFSGNFVGSIDNVSVKEVL